MACDRQQIDLRTDTPTQKSPNEQDTRKTHDNIPCIAHAPNIVPYVDVMHPSCNICQHPGKLGFRFCLSTCRDRGQVGVWSTFSSAACWITDLHAA
jgi:hypothetical protein